VCIRTESHAIRNADTVSCPSPRPTTTGGDCALLIIFAPQLVTPWKSVHKSTKRSSRSGPSVNFWSFRLHKAKSWWNWNSSLDWEDEFSIHEVKHASRSLKFRVNIAFLLRVLMIGKCIQPWYARARFSWYACHSRDPGSRDIAYDTWEGR
jgi:hypothetical protein